MLKTSLQRQKMDQKNKSYIEELRTQIGSRLILMPGSRVLIIKDNKLLLHLRSDFKIWGLPGGTPEPGESIEECIRREALEETGLTLGELEAIAYSSKVPNENLTYPNGDEVQGFTLLFLCKSFSGDIIKSSNESLDVQFFPISALPEMGRMDQRSLELFKRYEESKRFICD